MRLSFRLTLDCVKCKINTNSQTKIPSIFPDCSKTEVFPCLKASSSLPVVPDVGPVRFHVMKRSTGQLSYTTGWRLSGK